MKPRLNLRRWASVGFPTVAAMATALACSSSDGGNAGLADAGTAGGTAGVGGAAGTGGARATGGTSAAIAAGGTTEAGGVTGAGGTTNAAGGAGALSGAPDAAAPPDASSPSPSPDAAAPDAGDGGIGTGCGRDSDGDGITDAIEGRGNTPPIDTDQDGTPDYLDTDSDGDTILDSVEWIAAGCQTAPFAAPNDTDGDGIPNFRDLDSDNDHVGDGCEARGNVSPNATDSSLPVRDTNADGVPDYLDKDSDGDLLLDGTEDTNDNCVVDAGETDRLLPDSDGDGVNDLIEVTLMGIPCARDGACTPEKAGKFYFVVPYSVGGTLAPSPLGAPLAVSTSLEKGDVGIVVDTTGSMGGEIAGLKNSLSTIVSALAASIPDLGIGIAGHDDVPNGTNGVCADKPWYLPSGTMVDVSQGGAALPAGVASAQAAANGLTLGNGNDTPESQVLALVHAIRGDAISWPAGTCSAGQVAVDAGGGSGAFGAFHFRSDAFPILIEVSDAPFHNGIRVGGTVVHDAYSFSTFNSSDLVNAIKSANARFIGLACATTTSTDAAIRNATSTDSAYGDMAYITDNTNSYVSPATYGGSCKTGLNGAAVTADGPGGTCRNVFSCNHDGSGMAAAVASAVHAVVSSVRVDVHVQATSAAGAVDSVDAFVQKIEPSPTGGTDPVSGTLCVTFDPSTLIDRYNTPKSAIGAGDIKETIGGLAAGPKYCFNVVPKANTSVPASASAQIFTATLRVLAANGSSTLALGTDRDVLFVVPPVAN